MDDYMAPHNCYRCKGEDKWASIAVGSDEEWQRFCKAIGSPEWTQEPKFANALNRWKNQEELDRLITGWTETKGHYEVMQILQDAGVAVMPSFNSAEIFNDRHFKERQFVGEVVYDGQKQIVLGVPFKMSKTQTDVFHPAPKWGEHTDDVLKNTLHMKEEDIKSLKERNVIK